MLSRVESSELLLLRPTSTQLQIATKVATVAKVHLDLMSATSTTTLEAFRAFANSFESDPCSFNSHSSHKARKSTFECRMTYSFTPKARAVLFLNSPPLRRWRTLMLPTTFRLPHVPPTLGARHLELAKRGTATLQLAGDNSYSGGTVVLGGAFMASSRTASGTGKLQRRCRAVRNPLVSTVEGYYGIFEKFTFPDGGFH
ncbi:hypothetical protein BJ742DRAFT_903299 [Cladochytrium replicatum]|nr:hypothetical protein BJ742DRAFT_903299 [Cladochytrium replicatum]